MVTRHRGIITKKAAPGNPGTIFDGHAVSFYRDSPQVNGFAEGDLCDYTISISGEGREAVHILPPTGRGPNSPEARAFAGLEPLPEEPRKGASQSAASQETASDNTQPHPEDAPEEDSGLLPVYREFRSILISRDMDKSAFENRFTGDRVLLLSIPYHFSCAPNMPCSRSMVERHLLSLAESMGFNAVLSNNFSGPGHHNRPPLTTLPETLGTPEPESIAAELEWIPEEEDENEGESAIRVYHIDAVLGYFVEIAEYSDNAALARERNRFFARKRNLILEAFNKHRAVKATGQKAVLIIAIIGITLLILLIWQLWKGGNYLLYQLFG